MKAIVAEAHAFLQEQGCINIGVPLGEPSKDEEPEEEGLDDDELRVAVYELLKAVDLDVGHLYLICMADTPCLCTLRDVMILTMMVIV